MTPPLSSLSSSPTSSLGSRLLAATGTLALLAAVGLFTSRPAHSGGGPVPVAVSNVPLPTTDADNPGRQPFQSVVDFPIIDGNTSGSGSIQVPAGKRLVVQTVCSYRFSDTGVSLSPGQSVRTYLGSTVDGQAADYTLPLVPTDGTPYPGTTQALNVYADPGTSLIINVYRTGSKGAESEEVSVSGYLVDVP